VSLRTVQCELTLSVGTIVEHRAVILLYVVAGRGGGESLRSSLASSILKTDKRFNDLRCEVLMV
jgi:hypothetical protein